MDVSDYRQQYQKQLERVTQQQAPYRDFLDKSKPVSQRLETLNSTARFRNQGEVEQTVEIICDREENNLLRASALQAIGINLAKDPNLIDKVLELLGDDTEPPELRLAALKELQNLSFSSAVFKSKRAEYLATLRSIVDDNHATLRQLALEILAIEKDEYAQRRLLDQLRGRSPALIRTSKAIQLLGYDIHAEYYPILQEILKNSPSQDVKKEAVRLLGTVSSSKQYLTEILRDKSEHRAVRKISAVALQSLSPEEFEEQAKQIVLDDDDDDDLRAVCVNALDRFANQTLLNQDSILKTHLKRLSENSISRQLKKATAKYLLRHDN